MADPRLTAVYEAASFLFIRQSYERTQVSDIARQAGVATGTIYNLFAGKKAILHFVLLCTLDKAYLGNDLLLPVQEVEHGLIIRHLSRVAEDLLGQLEARGKNGDLSLSFSQTMTLTLDYAADYQVAFNIINDNRAVLADVREVYQGFVKRLYNVIEENLNRGIARGEVRDVDFPSLHIRSVMDHIIWWSMHMPYAVPDTAITPAEAKAVAMDILHHAYLVNPHQ